MAKKENSALPSVADAASRLETTTSKLDAAREALAAAESEYTEACTEFDAAVAAARKSCSR